MPQGPQWRSLQDVQSNRDAQNNTRKDREKDKERDLERDKETHRERERESERDPEKDTQRHRERLAALQCRAEGSACCPYWRPVSLILYW